MNSSASTFKYHLLALFSAIMWGTTFVSTKVLINHGLSPAAIFLYRFVLAYVGIWLIAPRKLFCGNLRDELMMMAAGLTGGSLYFILENSALEITLASNVSLIISTAPLLTALLVRLFHRNEQMNPGFIYGSLIALLGVAFVVFNGHFVLKLSPLGDTLTLLASLMWAFYSLIIKKLDNRYHVLFITRKVFFYGLLTILPIFIFRPSQVDLKVFVSPVVWGNLLFLGFIASMLCYILWNIAVKHLGAVRASNYIYINPLVTLITAAIVLHEQITLIALLGGVCILIGVYVAERGFVLPWSVKRKRECL